MDGRVHIPKVPLIGWNLPVGVQVVFPQHQHQLVLSKVWVNQADGNNVEGQVPRRIPGILPLVGHGNDVVVLHVEPFAVAHAPALIDGGPGSDTPLPQPQIQIVVEVLLGPHHPGQSLPHDIGAIGVGLHRRRNHRGVEFIGFLEAAGKGLLEVIAERDCPPALAVAWSGAA
jgi:hypothetical protein